MPPPPPQSREVNPAPAWADGSSVEVQQAGDLLPVGMTVRVLAPTFVVPAPMGAAFETLSVPVRYQDPGDVSCGVQALGMALDALPGAAPTSGALLGLLQDNGMMYDFGTGVEELAYAAQSFGYKGSFAFHGASLDQLRAELAGGNPVVVGLGTETTAGHFVTVTGISPDGESHGDASRWVAYNDPTLGEQVLSAAEFTRLWGMQGNSGVAVATEPPAEVADPGVLSLWVAFAAGLMALVSTTPLAKLRQGIGGMLISGATGGGRGAPALKPAPKPASKAAPPKKEKEKAPKKPAAPATASIGPSEARFITKVVPEPAPVFPSEARFITKVVPEPAPTFPSEARFVSNFVPPPPTPTPTPGYPKPRFDEERDPQPQVPVCTPVPRYSLVAGPTPTPTATPVSPVTIADLLGAGCDLASAVDPLQKNPAFVGTNVGVGQMIDEAAAQLGAIPAPNPWFAVAQLFVTSAKFFKDNVSSAYSFVCEQTDKEGLYYDVLPLDSIASDVAGRWNGFTLPKKIAIGTMAALIIATVVLAL